MSWFMFAALSTAFSVIYGLLSRVLATKSSDPRVFAVIYNGLVAVLAVGLVAVEPITWHPLTAPVLLSACLAMTAWVIFARLEFYARKAVDASTLTIVFRIGYAVAFLGGFLILREAFTLQKALALILIVAANLLIIPRRRLNMHSGFSTGIALSAVYGIAVTLDKLASPHFPLAIYTVLAFGIPSLVNALTPPIPLVSYLQELRTMKLSIVLLAVINVLAYYTILRALRIGEQTNVTMVTSTGEVFLILLGILLLKETAHARTKLAAGALAFAAMALLA